MKKTKQSSTFEEKPDPMRDLNIALESPDDDDDIIDLEDIIEMPDRPIDEDEDLDLDVDIFDDMDSDLDLEPEMPAQKAAQPLMKERDQELSSEEEELLKSFGVELEEDETLFEPTDFNSPEKTPMEGAAAQIFGENEESLLDEFMDKPAMPETRVNAAEKVDFEESVVEAMKAAEEAETTEFESAAAISDEAPAPVIEAASMSAPIPSPADLSQMAEELIGQLESRLQEHMSFLVESRLPDLVRSIINEEIEKLKDELRGDTN